MDFRFLAESDVFSYARAVALGMSPETLRRARRQGTIAAIHRGWYAVRQPRDETDRHRLRLTALLQEYGSDVVASHGSGLLWHGLPLHRVDLGTVHLMWSDPMPTRDFRAYSRVRIHEYVPGRWVQPGAQAVEPALAVVQAGTANVLSLLVAGDAALRRGVASPADLHEAATAMRGQRGITAARDALAHCDGRHESPGESMTAELLRNLGYAVTPQLVVPRAEAPGHHYIADFQIVGTRVLVEFDGRVKYADPASLFAEKQREDELRRLGFVIVRVTWADLQRPAVVRQRIASAIALARAASA